MHPASKVLEDWQIRCCLGPWGPYAIGRVPSAPRELDAHHTNGAGTNGIQNIELEWLAPEDTGGTSLTGYRIYRGFTPDGLTHYGDAPGDALKWEDEHCPLGHVCFYEVAAVNIAGEGPRSNQASEVGTVPPL